MRRMKEKRKNKRKKKTDRQGICSYEHYVALAPR